MTGTVTRGRRERWILSAGFCLILAVVLGLAGAVLKPERSLLRGEAGAAWAGYLAQPRDTVDVVFFGNSHVFDGVDPATIWRTRGITSYVLAGPTQPLEVTKHYVREAFATQHPRVVAVELSSMTYDRDRFVPTFHQINLGYMPWSAEKVQAIIDATPAGQRTGVAVDLWTYHTRWSQLKTRDFDLADKNRSDAFMKGWSPAVRSKPVTPTPFVDPVAEKPRDLAATARNIRQLRDIAETCRDNDAQLVLFLTPTGPPGGYSRFLSRAASSLEAEFDNVSVLDLSAPGAVPGLSYASDFHDGGHLSYTGAEKSSATLARSLSGRFDLTDHRKDPAYLRWDTDANERDRHLASLTK
jgi:hypothetical protein